MCDSGPSKLWKHPFPIPEALHVRSLLHWRRRLREGPPEVRRVITGTPPQSPDPPFMLAPQR